MQTVPGLIGAVFTLITVLGGMFILLKKGYKATRKVQQKANNIYDSIVGSEPIVDPETGKVLIPARPAIGTRVATLEESIVVVTQTLEKLVDVDERLTEIADRQTAAEHAKQVEHQKLWDAIDQLKTSSE